MSKKAALRVRIDKMAYEVSYHHEQYLICDPAHLETRKIHRIAWIEKKRELETLIKRHAKMKDPQYAPSFLEQLRNL